MSRLPAKYQALAPQVKLGDDGRDYWHVAGRRLRPISRGVAAALDDRTTVDDTVLTWEDVPRQTYDPVARLEAMDRDATDVQVFFPNLSKVWASPEVSDAVSSAYRMACIRIYNDWVLEAWHQFSPRFIAQCLAPIWDVELAVAEVQRRAARGHRALMWYLAPEVLGVPHFNDTYWDPLYRACEEAGLPMVFHIAYHYAWPDRSGMATTVRRSRPACLCERW